MPLIKSLGSAGLFVVVGLSVSLTVLRIGQTVVHLTTHDVGASSHSVLSPLLSATTPVPKTPQNRNSTHLPLFVSQTPNRPTAG